MLREGTPEGLEKTRHVFSTWVYPLLHPLGKVSSRPPHYPGPHGLCRLSGFHQERGEQSGTGARGVGFLNRHFKVPENYIGWSVWVANFFDQYIEIRAGDKIIDTFQL